MLYGQEILGEKEVIDQWVYSVFLFYFLHINVLGSIVLLLFRLIIMCLDWVVYWDDCFYGHPCRYFF